MQYKVDLSKSARKDILKVPFYVVRKLQDWVEDVEDRGLHEVRKIPSYHDEPLQGNRKGQRSMRLSKSYRAFYREVDGEIIWVEVIEVNKHEY